MSTCGNEERKNERMIKEQVIASVKKTDERIKSRQKIIKPKIKLMKQRKEARKGKLMNKRVKYTNTITFSPKKKAKRRRNSKAEGWRQKLRKIDKPK